MPTKTQAIKAFLEAKAPDDLARFYNHDMECQVNVAQDNGERIDGEFKGRRWHGWTDGLTTWKSFRIPYKANTESPEYIDSEIKFDLAEHAEAIGMTGWDWKNRCSRWVAFDFDAITGHSEKHTKKLKPDEISEIQDAAYKIPWVTIRKSTSGRGLHLYVMLNNIPTKSHVEHAALARAILGMMCALTGFDFDTRVDMCGGNMWVWHRKMIDTDGLIIIKQGIKLADPPPNWQDHINVIKGSRRRRNLPQVIDDTKSADYFEEIAGQRPRIKLEASHKKLIEYLKDEDVTWWWDQDHYMLVTHTTHLRDAHSTIGAEGVFETISEGKEPGDYNCFLFPLRGGGWVVRRYTMGVQEHESWEQDGHGWTRCYFDRRPDLNTACRTYKGVEDPKGGFIFREAEVAAKAALLMGVDLKISTAMSGRKCKLKEHKDGRLVIEVQRESHDDAGMMPNWLPEKDNWVKIENTQIQSPVEPDIANYDDLVRHLVTPDGHDCGWMVNVNGSWHTETLANVKLALQYTGLSPKEANQVLGSSVLKCWKLVNLPFQPEYPGDRRWNLKAAKLRFTPSPEPEPTPTWNKILNHTGEELTEALSTSSWAKANGIKTGGDYLRCWIASMFQYPLEPLPYLFLWGDENAGKSVLHESLSLLMTSGVKRADNALTSQGNFNAEIEGAVLCTIEEIDLGRNRTALNKMKDWVTSREIPIHVKGLTPYQVRNTTHWIQCANKIGYCPIFPGDTRITMIHVSELDPLEMIPRRRLVPMLEKEASDFLSYLISLELPESSDRLNIPAIVTSDKIQAAEYNETDLERFIKEYCVYCAGNSILFKDFYERFMRNCDPETIQYWTKIRVGKEIPPKFCKGKSRSNGQMYIGNIRFRDNEAKITGSKLVLSEDGYLSEVIINA